MILLCLLSLAHAGYTKVGSSIILEGTPDIGQIGTFLSNMPDYNELNGRWKPVGRDLQKIDGLGMAHVRDYGESAHGVMWTISVPSIPDIMHLFSTDKTLASLTSAEMADRISSEFFELIVAWTKSKKKQPHVCKQQPLSELTEKIFVAIAQKCGTEQLKKSVEEAEIAMPPQQQAALESVKEMFKRATQQYNETQKQPEHQEATGSSNNTQATSSGNPSPNKTPEDITPPPSAAPMRQAGLGTPLIPIQVATKNAISGTSAAQTTPNNTQHKKKAPDEKSKAARLAEEKEREQKRVELENQKFQEPLHEKERIAAAQMEQTQKEYSQKMLDLFLAQTQVASSTLMAEETRHRAEIAEQRIRSLLFFYEPVEKDGREQITINANKAHEEEKIRLEKLAQIQKRRQERLAAIEQQKLSLFAEELKDRQRIEKDFDQYALDMSTALPQLIKETDAEKFFAGLGLQLKHDSVEDDWNTIHVLSEQFVEKIWTPIKDQPNVPDPIYQVTRFNIGTARLLARILERKMQNSCKEMENSIEQLSTEFDNDGAYKILGIDQENFKTLNGQEQLEILLSKDEEKQAYWKTYVTRFHHAYNHSKEFNHIILINRASVYCAVRRIMRINGTLMDAFVKRLNGIPDSGNTDLRISECGQAAFKRAKDLAAQFVKDGSPDLSSPETVKESCKQAYRKRALDVHPDKHPELGTASFQQLQKSYDLILTLCDRAKL